MKYPHDVQQEWFTKLIQTAKDTEWGKKHGYASIKNFDEFRQRVPIQDYESLKSDINRIKQGEQNILWPTEIKWFAKSSGTTSDKSKFIPVSRESLEECHYKGGKDLLSLYYNNVPDSKLFSGKTLVVGGSSQVNPISTDSYYGDLSAIIMKNFPFWVEFKRTPSLSIALMDKWEEKLEKMANSTANEDVTNISGVPSWTLILLKRILEIKGTKDISKVWPNLELFMHGGVNFNPYKPQFQKLISASNMHYVETYNASEGFFGIQDQLFNEGMLLMLDYGIFYEFMPMQQFDESSHETLQLHEVETGVNYVMLISTNAGLWRYQIGDTIAFISLNPYRIKVTGRTKHFINTFGEELMIHNVEQALAVATEKTKTIITEYTVGPVFMTDEATGGHQWLIEFETSPENPEYFCEILDNALKSVNSDYEAKRYQNMALQPPVLVQLPTGTFFNWMKSRNKLGGQNKVPRLFNDRKYVDSILDFAGWQKGEKIEAYLS